MNKLTPILLIVLFISGCDTYAKSEKDNAGNISVSNSFGKAGITEFTLNDGTKCAALIGYYKGAITCNWSQSK